MKRKIFVAAIAVCLVAVLACGTLAYFTATREVTNSFMTAKYDPEHPDDKPTKDELFSVVVEETDPTDDQKTSTNGNTYEDIEPGDKFKKDPTVKNTGSYDQWVRVSVTFDKTDEWAKAGVSYDKLFDTLVTAGYVKENWTRVDPTAVVNKTATYTFYLKSKLAPNNKATLFTEVTVPTTLTVENMTELCEFNVTVKAEAIQTANTADNCFDAFKNCWPSK